MLRRLLIVLVLCGYAAAVPAQTLQGRITDAETGASLIGATIFVPSTQQGTATDMDGGYRLMLERPGTYRLVVSFVGYQSATKTVDLGADETRTLDLTLQHTTLEAPAITITAKAQASDILSTPQSVTVLDSGEILRRLGTTAFDALDETAGVRLLRTGPGIAKPMIRGLTAQRVLVVQNGVRQEGQQWGDEHAPELDAFGVDRIEVVRGPASLLYGSDALGGVIQAASGDLFEYRSPLSGEAAVQAMSNTRQGAGHLQLGRRSGESVYEGALTVRRAGSYATPTTVVPNTGLEEVSGALRLGRAFAWGRVQAEYQHFGSRLGLFEPELLEADKVDRFDIDQPYQRVLHDRVKVQLNAPIGGHRIAWVTNWQQNRRKEFEDHEEGEVAATKRLDEDIDSEVEAGPALFLRLNTVMSDLRFHHRPVGRLFGTIGVSGLFQKNETLAEESLIPGARTWNGSVYVFEEWMLPALTVSGGLRFDARRLDVDANEELGVTVQTRSYTSLTGALGLAWQPRQGLSLAVNAGRAWRAPVLVELFGNGVHEGTIRFERGDPALDPEESLSLEGIVRWLTPHVHLEATAFVNHINDYIFPSPTDQTDPESGFFIYLYEQAEARLWGGELRADVHPHVVEWLRFHLTGDITRTRNLDTDAPLPFSPAPRLGVGVTVEQPRLGPAEDVRLDVGPTFVAEQDRIAPTEIATEGYTLWDASFSATLHAYGVTVTPVLAVDNLFDEAYINHLSRFKPHGVLNPGRNVRFQMKVGF